MEAIAAVLPAYAGLTYERLGALGVTLPDGDAEAAPPAGSQEATR
jgi:hypothetical protein